MSAARWPTWALRLVVRVAAALHVRPAFVVECEEELWFRIGIAIARMRAERFAREHGCNCAGGVA